MEAHGLAALVEVSADRDGGVAVVGVGVDEEMAVADVVVDLLRLLGHLADFIGLLVWSGRCAWPWWSAGWRGW